MNGPEGPTEAELRARLDALGVDLTPQAQARVLDGARHLASGAVSLRAWLAAQDPAAE